MGIKHDFGPLTFGFDIGIASVGWAVLSPNLVVDLGARCFDRAETAKEGESLNLARRMARLTRRRLTRRAWRIAKLAKILKREGVVDDALAFRQSKGAMISPWQLRVEGLDRKLDATEWARVLVHICKHRGFHWVSRAEERAAESDEKGEGGKVKKGLSGTKKLMEEKKYRTVAEMVLAEFPDAQRNKAGEYTKAVSRKLLGEELGLLFTRQRQLGNQHASDILEAEMLGSGVERGGLFWLQKPALSGAALLKMLGKCTFEKEEFRAPKASFTAERHVWLTRLVNLRLIINGAERAMTEPEWRLALELPYQSAEKFTYKHLRKALVAAGLDDNQLKFKGLLYPRGWPQKEDKEKNPEEMALAKLTGWHTLRLTLEKAGLADEWRLIATTALDGNPSLLDDIAWILSVYKEDDEVRQQLNGLALPSKGKMIEALLDIRFDKFHALSLKALRQIVPYMALQQRYDEACVSAGYHHSQQFKVGSGTAKLLPSLYKNRDKTGRMLFNGDMNDIPKNPVVLRSLNQARKVLNALIKKYGSPHAVHVELARELSKPFDERRDIAKEQEAFRVRNAADKTKFVETFSIIGAPKGKDFEKFRLYNEQSGKCAYSVAPLDVQRLFEEGYVEVDHVLPYSRSFDDSKSNRVLVLTRENRNKGNRTPYEYLDGASNSPAWRNFVAFVESNKQFRQAKRMRLLRKDFDAKASAEFRERNLNDTRYICKFFKNQIEQFLQLAPTSEERRCVVLSGQMTAFLRARWGFIKVREANDRHHALDAVIVAACSHGMVKRLSDYSRRKELRQVRDGFVDVETGEIINPAMHQQLHEHFPQPWAYFREEVEARLKMDNVEMMRAELTRLGNYDATALANAKPLFVSRAPQRRSGGAAHKETVYSQPERLIKDGSVTEKASLASLTMADLDRMVDPNRNVKLYAAIRAEMVAHGGKGDKAFPKGSVFRKPGYDDYSVGPIVRTVTLVIDKLTGIPVRGGIAKNDTMLRVDVFSKAGKFHLVPVYVHHRAMGLPNRAILAFKDESEWTLIDDTFAWCFSLYPNDLVVVQQKNKAAIVGYYSSCHRGTGNLNLWAIDRKNTVGKNGMIEGIGVKTAVSLEKFHVDVLGNNFPAAWASRRGLA